MEVLFFVQNIFKMFTVHLFEFYISYVILQKSFKNINAYLGANIDMKLFRIYLWPEFRKHFKICMILREKFLLAMNPTYTNIFIEQSEVRHSRLNQTSRNVRGKEFSNINNI